MKDYFKVKDIFLLSLLFILFTIIGTLSHELGHYIPAKYFKEKPVLHYASVHRLASLSNTCIKESRRFMHVYCDFESVPKPERETFFELKRKSQERNFIISAGGPLQTVITGTLGFLVLLYKRGKNKSLNFGWIEWLAVYLSFFWSRQIANCAIIFYRQLSSGGRLSSGDEVKLSHYLGMPSYSLNYLTASLGLLICTYVVFVLIPRKYRLSFIMAGILGSGAGFIIWMRHLGPLLLP